jgi:hypothetical protein
MLIWMFCPSVAILHRKRAVGTGPEHDDDALDLVAKHVEDRMTPHSLVPPWIDESPDSSASFGRFRIHGNCARTS